MVLAGKGITVNRHVAAFALILLALTAAIQVASVEAATFRFESNVDLSSFGGNQNGSLIVDWTFDPSAVGGTINPPNSTPFQRYGGIFGTINIEDEIFEFNAGTIDVWNDRFDSKWPDGFSLEAKNPGLQTMGQLLAAQNRHLQSVRFLLGGPSNILDSDALPTLASLSLLGLITGGALIQINPNAFQGATVATDGEFATSDVSPVPLPAALPLFGTGLAVMGFIGWRRKRRMTAEAA